jgi:hypothetical protein
MTTKKAVKPAQRRPPRKGAPLTEKDVLFCHLIMKGLPDPKATQLERIEAAGEELAYSKAEPAASITASRSKCTSKSTARS